ncbi:MAG: hypothetical protein ACREP9_10115 [Candidatus Dormibacteraceae bacterium]
MRARDPDQPHRASTPLELLFDLRFVVAVAAVGAGLEVAIDATEHTASVSAQTAALAVAIPVAVLLLVLIWLRRFTVPAQLDTRWPWGAPSWCFYWLCPPGCSGSVAPCSPLPGHGHHARRPSVRHPPGVETLIWNSVSLRPSVTPPDRRALCGEVCYCVRGLDLVLTACQ